MVSKAAAKRGKAYAAYLVDPHWNQNNQAAPSFGFPSTGLTQAQSDFEAMKEITKGLNLSGSAAARTYFSQFSPEVDALTKPTPDQFAARITDWMNQAPTASPGLLTALAQGGLTMDHPGVQEALAADSAIQHQADSTTQPSAGSAANADAGESWLETTLKATTRNAFDILQAPLQAVQGAMSGVSGSLGILGADAKPGGPDWGQAAAQLFGLLPPVAGALEAGGVYTAPNPWEQTNAGQSLLDLAGLPQGTTTGTEVTPGVGTVTQGDGWLAPDENSGIGLAQRNAAYQSARTKFGDSWTLGRGLASMAVDSPDSTLYKVASGLVDAGVAIFLDPTLVAGKITKSAMVAKTAREALAAREAAAPFAGAVKTAEEATAAAAEAKVASRDALEAEIQALEKAGKKLSPEEIDQARALMNEHADALASRADAQGHIDVYHGASTEEQVATASANTEAHYNLTLELQDVRDRLNIQQTRTEANRAARSVPGRIVLDEPNAGLVDELHTKYGPGGVENIFADLSADAAHITEPTVGGVFTDAALGATKRGRTATYEPAFGVEGETVAAWTGRTAPKIVNQADAVGEEATRLASEYRSLLVGKKTKRPGVGSRGEAAQGMEELLTNPEYAATWGHVFSLANSTGTTKVLAEAMARSGVDGIEDIRSVLGNGQGGVWWGNVLDVRALPADVRSTMARGALPEIQADTRALRAQEKDILDQMKSMAVDSKARVQAAIDLHDASAKVRTVDRLDEAKAMREQMMAEAGTIVKPDFTHINDSSALYNFIFGGPGRFGRVNHGERSINALLEMDDPLQIMRLTGWDANLSKGVAAATTRDELFGALAHEVGMKVDHASGQITSGLAYKRGVAAERGRFWRSLDIMANSRMGTFANWTKTIVPIGQRIDYGNADDVVQKMDNYLTYFKMDREAVDVHLRKMIAEPTEAGQRNNVIAAFNDLEQHLLTRISGKFGLTGPGRERLNELAREGTRVYENGSAHEYRYYQERLAMEGWMGHILSDGEAVILPNAMIESEFARGGVALPDPRELTTALGKISGVIDQLPTRSATEWMMKVSTDWWRTAILVRGAYIVRNIAEEQIRMFLSGHPTVFNSPLTAAASAMALKENHSPVVSAVLKRMKTYDQGIDGTRFVVPRDMDNDLVALNDSFLGLMTDTSSLLDNRVSNVSFGHGYKLVGKTEDGFSKGWASELNRLRAAPTVGLVTGRWPDSLREMWKVVGGSGVNRDDVVMRWLFEHPEGAKFRADLEGAGEAMAKIVNDEMGMRSFLFGEKGSVRARVNEATLGIPHLNEYVRMGILRDPQKGGGVLHDAQPLRHEVTKPTTDKKLSVLLREKYADQIPMDAKPEFPTAWAGGKFFTEDPTLVDKFFSFSAKMERTSSLGPEWKYGYWDEVAKHSHLLDAEGLAKARLHAAKSLPRGHDARKLLDNAPGTGTLGAKEIHDIASARAGQHVKDLFYDARNRNAGWHQVRLAIPFGQAWADTAKRWTQVGLVQNPLQVYKAGKAMNALMERGSNTIYDVTNAIDPLQDVQYDDSQGFFYQDPNRGGSRMFHYPMFATPLAGIMASTQDTQLAFSGSMSGLNLAFSGDNPLPGLGPVATAALGATGITDKPGLIGETLQKMAYPFGEPDPETGMVDSALPAWMKYAVFGAGLVPGGGEQWRRQQEKGALIATASRHDYGDLTKPENQDKWFQDADGLARVASFIRGFGAFMLPTSPVSEWQMKDKAGSWLPVASVAENYYSSAREKGPDQAIMELANTYGENGLAAIIPSTTGDRSLSDEAYQYLKKHPEIPTSQYDAVALMFPGRVGPIALAWQKNSGARRDLSFAEKEDKAYGLLYRLQLAEVYRAGEENSWTADQIQAGKDAVLDRFGGVVPSGSFDPNYTANGMANLKNLLQTPTGQSMPGAADAMSMLNIYETALADYRSTKADPRATLGGKNAALWRDEVGNALDQITARNPSALEVASLIRNAMGGK
ncbi:MAG: hypothetical protein ACOYB3_01705 [Azonexus sp.]